MEYQLVDRLSFQRFVRLRHSSQVPDAKTIWLFKERLKQAHAHLALFDAITAELGRHGYIARGGQMVDASLVTVPIQYTHAKEREAPEEQSPPVDLTPAQRRQRDTEATWTSKGQRSSYGYKLPVNADVQYKLVRKVMISAASEHDTNHLEAVLDPCNTRQSLYADKGYVDYERESRLRQAGLRVNIQRKARRGKRLSACQRRRNARISRTRIRVEHVFASLSHMGGKCLRTIGLARAEFQLTLKSACYNLRRLISLKAAGIEAI